MHPVPKTNLYLHDERRSTNALRLTSRRTAEAGRAPSTRAQWDATLATYASPVIGSTPVAEVDTEEVMRVLRPIWDTKTETAVRLRGRIESILDWATVSKYRHGENPARWRGHLDSLLGNPNKIAPVRNRPALPWEELPDFMADLTQREGVSARATQFAILTAGRSGEVRGATWSEIDGGANLWTVPAKRMKAGKEHRVPCPMRRARCCGSCRTIPSGRVDLGEKSIAACQLLLGGVLEVGKTLLHDRWRCGECADIVSGLATAGNARARINQRFPSKLVAIHSAIRPAKPF
jgi:hypothetical protein